ncbi:MAG: DNA topoisomerase I [Gammaproteobacteria bacterium]|nr:DNA topoisomerase I [Gammaproteobacteria bacterium]
MSKNLLIVESPAKASTIKKYLGGDFDVLASYGHVRDLIAKEGAVDPDCSFRMRYELIDKNVKHVNAIAKAVAKAEAIFLATDLDREGEAISWHLSEILNERGVLDAKPIYRVVFNEITERAIKEAISHPRSISTALVNAQQARRALDYLVGFNLSPLLWKKIKRGLSAGRVQSPALRLICEREQEIESFISREYWTIEADAQVEGGEFVAALTEFEQEKIKQFTIGDEARALHVRGELLRTGAGALRVQSVETRERRRNPAPPFITSTLQQEGVRKLGFTASRTMRVAQQLYEGVSTALGSTGLITYMRTDSVSLSTEAVEEIRVFVRDRYGLDHVPRTPRVFKTNSKNAQEAHEAIRPTRIAQTPADLAPYLNAEQLKLYDLIWKRTVACQMNQAVIDTVSANLACGDNGVFRASGSTIREPGFMAVYLEDTDDGGREPDGGKLPPLVEGQTVTLNGIRAEQHFTEPPPRYSEASLVKSLEEYGIGRPSTYAAIISTLQQREYVELERKRFRPTDIGRIVNAFLTSHFDQYVDYEFTARLEDELDAISRGEKDWIPVLDDFWRPFSERIRDKESSVTRQEATQARQLGQDPVSGKPVSVRMGRFGPYVAIGSPEDKEKPRFYGLKPGQRLDTLTLDEALDLTKLPRDLGDTEDGMAVSANIGRFGPYVKYGSKYVSLPKDDDPYTITLSRALQLIEEKRAADAAKQLRVFSGSDVRVLRGRFGPYVTDGKKNARIPKDRAPEDLTLEDCERLIAEAPEKAKGRFRKRTK